MTSATGPPDRWITTFVASVVPCTTRDTARRLDAGFGQHLPHAVGRRPRRGSSGVVSTLPIRTVAVTAREHDVRERPADVDADEPGSSPLRRSPLTVRR